METCDVRGAGCSDQSFLTPPDGRLLDEPDECDEPEPLRVDEAELLGAGELPELDRVDGVELDREEPPEVELGGRTAAGGRLLLPLVPICRPGCDGEVRGTMIGREPDELPGETTGAREPVDRGIKPEPPRVVGLPVTPGMDGVDGRERVTNGLR